MSEVQLYRQAGTCLCIHPEVDSRANLKSVSHRYHLFEVAFV